MEVEIKLPKGVYLYNDEEMLGSPGGFGSVYLGKNEDGNECAIKQLRISAEESSFRELSIAGHLEKEEFEHIIKILDSGQDAESGRTYIVMNRAEMSLQDYIDGDTDISENVVDIMIQIVSGLLELSGFVHRDLKPGNVLFEKGVWKISDFGIARFVEKSTSLKTLKESLTPAYAAPEQWALEHATKATDVYALGCIGYALITGAPPFSGPEVEDYKRQHTQETPPPLQECNPTLATMIGLMLRKNPRSRPTIERVADSLAKISENSNNSNSTAGREELAAAAMMASQEELQEEAARQTIQQELENRGKLGKEALSMFNDLISRLVSLISDIAPNINSYDGVKLLYRNMEVWTPKVPSLELIQKGDFRQSKWDVVCGRIMGVTQLDPSYSWASNFWYAMIDDSEGYRWYEVGYMINPLVRGYEPNTPFCVTEIEKADMAASNIIDTYQHAYEPRPIDQDNAEEFYERWMRMIAQALEGKLHRPRSLPIRM